MLHNVRSAHNVGSIFRSAHAAGVSHVWLTGYTPTPQDRFGRVKRKIEKTALGAERKVPWSTYRSFGSALKALKKNDVKLVAVEQTLSALDYRMFKPTEPTCFIFGNEVRGLSKQIIAQADAVIYIPLPGSKESLNVSVTAGIILFSMLH